MTNRSYLHVLISTLTLSSVTLFSSRVAAQYDCSSPDPADWPAPARPYFMIAFDTSGSMTSSVSSSNSCGYPNDRLGHGRCAVMNTVLAFSGQASFGLASFAREIEDCDAGCFSGCNFSNLPNNSGGGCGTGCGPEPNADTSSSTRAGAYVRVPLLSDLTAPYPAGVNAEQMLTWVDDDCTNSEELFADGCTPLNGILRDMFRYYSDEWRHPSGWPSYASPLGTMAAGERGCRSVNVILVTDGGETCDTDTSAVDAAGDLLAGFTKDGISWSVPTFVIDFGNTGALADDIAAAGGTGVAQSATNEVELAQALANIIASAVQPETCDNGDNNCNGCVDEGYKKYCNTAQLCCAWASDADRDACLASYEASVTSNPPSGNLDLLPCTTPGQQTDPDAWLCYDPGDICDGVDNNCQDGADESQLTCGSPPHCPSPETCDGIDNDCNGQIDDGAGCSPCIASPEICDGCDNDCDGIVDNGTFNDQICGLPSPAHCEGTRTCEAAQIAPFQGGCMPGAGYGSCSNTILAETCNGEDDNCNGSVDEGFVASDCIPASHPAGLVYDDTFALSQCKRGQSQCDGANGAICVGGQGPSPEVCDGVDNDCDGLVDAADPGGVYGTGQQCGINNLPCTPGLTECVGGALVCSGGNLPQNEICDGIDNNCNGAVDEAPLLDAPLPGMQGCWSLTGTTCSHGLLFWDPPAGQTDCHGLGTLGAPCAAGVLQCIAGGWTCNHDHPPENEVCDGLDNDCDGTPDDGNLPQVGDACGPDILPCVPGQLACNAGALVCVGGITGSPEICNNIDDDCNGITDDGIPNMGACTMPYDAGDYPGDRSHLPCQPGQLECDGMGNWLCVGGVAPHPEVCDGLDNDCDASVDETGAAPDGLNGTANPFPPPDASIGDICGVATGACAPGSYVCDNGLFQCFGGQGPIVETCDCIDNDCDGDADELPGDGEQPLCSPGKDCVAASDFCQCAPPCGATEYPCPPGQKCESVTIQGTGATGFYCVVDYDAICGDCAAQTVTHDDDAVECAPAGTDPPGCLETPECMCKLQNGCHAPCFDVTCSPGKICSSFGPTPGTCVDDICYQTGCPGCNQACHDAECVDNPCTPQTCPADEVCKPSADWSAAECQPSCATVTCPSGQDCVDGVCVPWCDPACSGDDVCDPTALTCVPSLCHAGSCPNGAYCDPLTGMCGDEPCAGVVCPDGQTCSDGECTLGEVDPGSGGAGGDGSGGDGSEGGALPTGLIIQPDGGGGCICELSAPHRGRWPWLAWVGLGLTLVRRRRSSREAVTR